MINCAASMSLNAHERAIDEAETMYEKKHSIEYDLTHDFDTFASALVELGSDLPDTFAVKKYALVAAVHNGDWEHEHKGKAADFMYEGLGKCVAEEDHFKEMVINWFSQGEFFDTRQLLLDDLFFMYVWHQDRTNADKEIDYIFDELIEMMTEHLLNQEEK